MNSTDNFKATTVDWSDDRHFHTSGFIELRRNRVPTSPAIRIRKQVIGTMNLAGALALGLCLILTSAWSQKPDPAPAEEARQLLKQGKAAEARTQLEALLRSRPDSLEALNLLAQSYLQEDNYESALRTIRKALKSSQLNPQVVATYGHCLFREGDLSQAETEFRKSLKMDATQASAHLGIGRILLSRLKSAEALQALQRALQLAPDLEDAYFYASDFYCIEMYIWVDILFV